MLQTQDENDDDDDEEEYDSDDQDEHVAEEQVDGEEQWEQGEQAIGGEVNDDDARFTEYQFFRSEDNIDLRSLDGEGEDGADIDMVSKHKGQENGRGIETTRGW